MTEFLVRKLMVHCPTVADKIRRPERYFATLSATAEKSSFFEVLVFMQWLWCWRCKTEMPMLDEVEYLEVYRLYGQGMSATKEFRQKWSLPLESIEREMRFKP